MQLIQPKWPHLPIRRRGPHTRRGGRNGRAVPSPFTAWPDLFLRFGRPRTCMGVSEGRRKSVLQYAPGPRQVVIATKVFFQVGPGPNDGGISRAHSMKPSMPVWGASHWRLLDIDFIHRLAPKRQSKDDGNAATWSRRARSRLQHGRRSVRQEAAGGREAWSHEVRGHYPSQMSPSASKGRHRSVASGRAALFGRKDLRSHHRGNASKPTIPTRAA